MRIAGNSFTDSMVTQLNQLAARQLQLQQQASTGQSIQAPSDNPAGMEEALNLQTENSAAGQYAQNVSTLQDRSTQISNALQQLKTISDRVGEIATQSDGTATTQELQANASEVGQLIQQAVQIMNTKDGNQYLFGGTASGQPPFVATTDANGNVTGVTYQGNTSVAESDIAANTAVSVDVPGENNSGSGPRGLISDSRYGADFFNHLISLQSHLASGNTTAISSTDQPALMNDENNLIYQIANNGTVQSRLDAAASAATTAQSALNTNITHVAGADLAQTLTQLTQAQNAYQVALQSSSSIMQLRQYLLSYIP